MCLDQARKCFRGSVICRQPTLLGHTRIFKAWTLHSSWHILPAHSQAHCIQIFLSISLRTAHVNSPDAHTPSLMQSMLEPHLPEPPQGTCILETAVTDSTVVPCTAGLLPVAYFCWPLLFLTSKCLSASRLTPKAVMSLYCMISSTQVT